MSITSFISPDISFDPEATQAMGFAFDEARRVLGLTDKVDAVTRLLADRIVDLASAGERDPIRLRDRALKYLANGGRPALG
jgi:hypothetical protein